MSENDAKLSLEKNIFNEKTDKKSSNLGLFDNVKLRQAFSLNGNHHISLSLALFTQVCQTEHALGGGEIYSRTVYRKEIVYIDLHAKKKKKGFKPN
jgi:hypothetical protein